MKHYNLQNISERLDRLKSGLNLIQKLQLLKLKTLKNKKLHI